MTELMNVTADVLRWARDAIGMTINDVAKKLDKEKNIIEAWEKGVELPTYGQLEKMADMYKRPLAVFFFPHPPEEESIALSFRTLPNTEINNIPPRVRYLVRQAEVFQLNMSELFGKKNPAEKIITHDSNLLRNTDPITLAKEAREYLGVSIDTQKQWKSSDDALKQWCGILENFGTFVFKDSFRNRGKKQPDSPYSGFCLYNDQFPIIYTNNNSPGKRQIFTLFHELAHLLSSTSGIDKRWMGDLAQDLSGEYQRKESLCNKFAGEFLIPSDDINPRLFAMRPSYENISEIAADYHVSKEVIIRRMLDLEIVTGNFYGAWRQKKLDKKRQKGKGGNYYSTKKKYLSQIYTREVLEQYNQGKITRKQAADYLDVKTGNLDQLKATILTESSAS